MHGQVHQNRINWFSEKRSGVDNAEKFDSSIYILHTCVRR